MARDADILEESTLAGFDGRSGAIVPVPTRYIEWLTKRPELMAEQWNKDPLFRETMLIVLRILF